MSKKAFDPASMSLEERSAALYQVAEDVEETSQPRLQDPNLLAVMRDLKANGKAPNDSLPNVQHLYKDNIHTLNILLTGTPDGVLDTGEGPKEIKVQPMMVPNDIYEPRLDMRKFLIFIYFMRKEFGDEPIPGRKDGFTPGDYWVHRAKEIATGWNANPVTWLRETVFTLIRKSLFLQGCSFPSSRTPEDDDDNTQENQWLQSLLQYSTYTALQDAARRHDIKPAKALCQGVKDALEKDLFRR